ncbi:hypothetical protein M0Q50_05850 [bacterium]|jgi:hypothetical protein|nr:hypothetical protein [bacterium]
MKIIRIPKSGYKPYNKCEIDISIQKDRCELTCYNEITFNFMLFFKYHYMNRFDKFRIINSKSLNFKNGTILKFNTLEELDNWLESIKVSPNDTVRYDYESNWKSPEYD